MKNPVVRTSRVPRFPSLALVACCALSLSPSLEAAGKKAMIRVILPVAPEGRAECVVATRSGKDGWREKQALEVRASFVSDWIEVPRDELGFCVKDGRKLEALAEFVIPEDLERAWVVVAPGAEKNRFAAHVIDAPKLGFANGGILVVNTTLRACTVKLGGKEVESKAGETVVAAPEPDDNRMYQLVVSHAGDDGKQVVCHDRFVAANEAAREFLFLMPDAEVGVRVASVSDFGPAE